MSDMSNGKTYTEVVAEFNSKLTDVRIEFIERVNQSDTAIMEKLGLIHTDLGRGDEKFKSMDKRLDVVTADTKTNARNIKVVGALEAALLIVCGWVGINK